MITSISGLLLAASTLGVVVLLLQLVALRRHLHEAPPMPRHFPGISVLKPLCGVDDDLEANLTGFATLAYPNYEVLFGVESTRDAAYPLACRMAARFPERVRVVVQRSAPGLNPKVNQLITLEKEARHDLLLVSDSNIRAVDGYLEETAARFEDPLVGLVSHPVIGAGERRIGALFDNVHMTAHVTVGVIAAKRIAGQDIVVGKSMALRRADLESLGGFESLKDVLAEDYVSGRRVPAELGKRVELARTPVFNVSRRRTVKQFLDRFGRWHVMHRFSVGPAVYVAELLLNPILLALFAWAVSPSRANAATFALICAVVALLDASFIRQLRREGIGFSGLLSLPFKHLLIGVAWMQGLLRNTVEWRGHPLRVLPGTRLARVEPELDPAEAAVTRKAAEGA